MWDAVAWQLVWDWGSKMGLGGLALWLIQRWTGSRDKALERGRQRIEEATPEIVSMNCTFTGDHHGTFTLRNRGSGIARDIRVGFTGSRNVARLHEIETDRTAETPDVSFADAPFFRQPLVEPAQLTVSFKDRYGTEYIVTLEVKQEGRADGRYNMAPAWREPNYSKPKLSKKLLREIGRS